MSINITDLKKKIIYKSAYRGTKEMDSLLSSFVKKYINVLNLEDLVCLSKLMDVDDENIYKFKQGITININIVDNRITKLFKEYVYKE